MIKGAKKAIVRTPHRLLGSKSTEDRIIIEWTKDFNTADAAFDLIINETKNFVTSWREICSSQTTLVSLLSTLYAPIVEENVYKLPQETPQSAIDALDAYSIAAQDIKDRVSPLLDQIESSVKQCKSARECLSAVSKALTKREHKKEDYDRHNNSVEKVIKKQGLSDKEQAQLTKLEQELENATDIFLAQDEKVKRIIPHVLRTISEFLNPLCAGIYLRQLEIFEIFRGSLFSYAQKQGLVSREPSTYSAIAEDWEDRFTAIQPQCEQGIVTLREGNAVTKPMNLPSKRLKDVAVGAGGTVLGATAHLTQKVITKAKHPHVSTIQFSSSKGLFRTEADLAENPGSPASPVPGRTAGLLSPLAAQSHGSPITSRFIETKDSDSIRSRVRAFSSSAARSLSPPSSVGNFPKPNPAPENENAVALFTFSGEEPGDVAFRVGEKIKVLDHGDETDDNWWFGQTEDGRIGLFPRNYIQIEDIPEPDAHASG